MVRMQDTDHRALAAGLLPVVLRAGALEMAYFRSDVAVERKNDDSPVTAADRDAEELITAALARLCPEIPVIGEEAASAGVAPETVIAGVVDGHDMGDLLMNCGPCP